MIVAAPAPLKGVLSAGPAAAALAEGIRAAGADALELPLADGGEGTLDALEAALGGERREAVVPDPLGRPVRAAWLLLPDGTAVVESAQAIGLPLLAHGERDPLRATSRGLGELIAAAVAERPRALVVGLGGSATVDGGRGLREALASLPLPTRVACDVTTLLDDAPRVFGPQKGAAPADVAELERRLVADESLRPFARLPGSGAAGGLGAALAALGAELVPGAGLVLEAVRFRERIRGAALVVTGEGTVDATTAAGKAPGEAARACRKAGVPCLVFGGLVLEPLPGSQTVALSGDPLRARADLVRLGSEAANRFRGARV